MNFAPINRLVHRDTRPKVVQDGSVVDIEFDVPERNMDTVVDRKRSTKYGDGAVLRLPNLQWSVNNPTLQFYAIYGMKPSDYDGTVCEVENKYLPLKWTGNEYVADVETALDGAQKALEEAEWFNPDIEIESTGERNSGVFGGGSPDPGTGNRGGVSYEQTVEIDMSDGSVKV